MVASPFSRGRLPDAPASGKRGHALAATGPRAPRSRASRHAGAREPCAGVSADRSAERARRRRPGNHRFLAAAAPDPRRPEPRPGHDGRALRRPAVSGVRGRRTGAAGARRRLARRRRHAHRRPHHRDRAARRRMRQRRRVRERLLRRRRLLRRGLRRGVRCVRGRRRRCARRPCTAREAGTACEGGVCGPNACEEVPETAPEAVDAGVDAAPADPGVDARPAEPMTDAGSAPVAGTDDDGGCGCRSGRGGAPLAVALALLGLLRAV